MSQNFNFTQPVAGGLNFSFGATGSGPYNDFNFIGFGYSPIEYNFHFGEGYNIHDVLKGTTSNFTSIWADVDAGLSAGKMYIGLLGYFNVINLSDQTIYDWYSETTKGRGNETLTGSDIVDINVT